MPSTKKSKPPKRYITLPCRMVQCVGDGTMRVEYGALVFPACPACCKRYDV